MLKLQKEPEKVAIFLDHRNLINQAYKEFKLRPELFQFHNKKNRQEDCEKLPKKRKRKAQETETSGSQADQQQLNGYLQLLPKPCSLESSAPTLAKSWESAYNVPQLHGANESGLMQRFQGQDEGNPTAFLIPNGSRFYNHNVDGLSSLLPQLLPAYDLIVLDPPWRNKYIRRLKKVRQELGYSMLGNDQLAQLPLSRLIHPRSLVAIWCTNSKLHQTALTEQLLPSWNLRLLHKLRWYKLSTDHQLIAPPQADDAQKQPYEMLFLASHANAPTDYGKALRQTELLLSIPSIVHSHKPPLLEWLSEHLELEEDQPAPHCLELFARYLQPHFTSIGLEVLKLMDERLYEVGAD
ncbi:hypothetical protein KR018_007379 [Drosophila ironensis]|nr:hypothetical protein KR018_007379 [Drosophila ironensis]